MLHLKVAPLIYEKWFGHVIKYQCPLHFIKQYIFFVILPVLQTPAFKNMLLQHQNLLIVFFFVLVLVKISKANL